MSLAQDLQAALGPNGWLTATDGGKAHRDWLDRYGEIPLGIARPASTQEVATALALCAAANVPVVPQGGNTSLAGGSVLGEPGGVILSLSRLNSIAPLDAAGATIEVGAGVILARLHQSLEGTGLMFPMHIGSEGSAQIGGLIGTNAGGSHAFRYGMMQDLVLGLEVVLADGTVWDGMRRVQKDNAGYQLRRLFCGAEGTLGVVTRAILKLSPEPVQRVTVLLAVSDVTAAIALAARCRTQAGEFLVALEFFSDFGLDMVLASAADIVFPLRRRAPVYLLIEAGAGSLHVPLETILTEIMDWGLEQGLILDGALAMSEAQRAAMWRLREEQPEGQRRAGAQLKHDISVPPGLLADFLDRAEGACEAILPGVRINAFGHLGDGNVHYNLSPPIGHLAFAELDSDFAIMLGKLATEMSGSFAAEHGLGRSKILLADSLRGAAERRLMARLKSAFDDVGNLNPGVIVPEKILYRP
jgi:FAD/FMN-containing dehydrogenase